MNQVQKLRLVYVELQRSMGGELTTRELLLLAKRLCDAYAEPWREGFEFVNASPITAWQAVDVAIADGGWREFVRETAANDNGEFEDGRPHTSTWSELSLLRRYA